MKKNKCVNFLLWLINVSSQIAIQDIKQGVQTVILFQKTPNLEKEVDLFVNRQLFALIIETRICK